VAILPPIEIYLGCTDADRNVDCLMMICCEMIGVLKMIMFRIYANNLSDNYGSALNDYIMHKNGNQRSIMRRHAFMGRIICYFLICPSYISSVILLLLPLLANNELTPINATGKDFMGIYPIPSRCTLGYFNPSNSIYRIIYFIQAVALFLSCNAYIGNICLLFQVFMRSLVLFLRKNDGKHRNSRYEDGFFPSIT